MAVWETEDEGQEATLPTLPAPRGKTLSRKSSKKSRRSVTPPRNSSSPAPPSTDHSDRVSRRHSRDPTTDDSISVLDPRRFTPTLHASLVSEILSLRRDQEEKIKFIEGLEDSLHSSRQEQENLEESSREVTRENRSLKKQLALLEGGASSALDELSRERDEAVDGVAETRKRLEVAQKKIRSQEEDSQRVHEQWAGDKNEWEEERRRYEHRLHVSESRLRAVLEEIAAHQLVHVEEEDEGEEEGEGEEGANEEGVGEGGGETRGRGQGPDARDDGASVRTMSMSGSVRYSIMNSPPKRPGQKSLADELGGFEPYDDTETDHDGRDSVLSHRHRRTYSRDSVLSRMHNRNMSIDSSRRPMSIARARLFALNPAVMGALGDPFHPPPPQDDTPPSPTKPAYADAAIQYSPPSSPKAGTAVAAVPEQPFAAMPEKVSRAEIPPRGDGEIEANQRRKRVSAPPVIFKPAVAVAVVTGIRMVSVGSQTVDAPLGPDIPKTGEPDSDAPAAELLPPVQPPPRKMVSSHTQTGLDPTPRSATPPPPLEVPSIAIHAPTSRPPSLGLPRLPQHFKDKGCQVSLGPREVKEACVQTDEILTTKRIAALPPHLQPSSITSRPVSPEATPRLPPAEARGIFTPVPGNLPPPRNPMRLAGRQALFSERPMSAGSLQSTHDAYPGNNDDGPLTGDGPVPIRRPQRFSSLFAGFGGGHSSDDDGEDFEADDDPSDSEYRTPLSAPRPKRSSVISIDTTSGTGSPGQVAAGAAVRPGPVKPSRYVAFEIGSSAALMDARNSLMRRQSVVKPDLRSPPERRNSRSNGIRRSALIQSGIASHQGGARSPSLTEDRDPPFPIPTRASSRQPQPPGDPSRPPNGWHRRVGSRTHRSGSIRKNRSAAVVHRQQRQRRHSSRSPPLTPSTEAPENPGLPALPGNGDVAATPRTNRDSVNGGARYWKTHRAQSSSLQGAAAAAASAATTQQQQQQQQQQRQQQGVGVVESIAQTMVGEWMYKYVRRRRSFGVSDGAARDENGNDRHKRWVWLAPYERAVLWSSKQPASGSALLGRSGRKLIIQSVLDVKDDNPPPKGAPSLFNRSILILTPQRALKFTAASSERHYLWLTALSFLAHSSQAVPDIHVNLQPPAQEPDFEFPAAAGRRAGIRDSIRLAKSKGATTPPPPKVPTMGLPPIAAPASEPSFAPSSIVPSIPESSAVPSSPISEIMGASLNEAFPALPGDQASQGPFRHSRDLSQDAAEAPFIPRFAERANSVLVHGRKRSNTGGHAPPPLSYRGFSSPVSTVHAGSGSGSGSGGGSHHHRNPTDSTNGGMSIGTGVSSDMFISAASSNHTWGTGGIVGGMFGGGGASIASSARPSELSTRPGSNFLFDAIGTMRMEAFISPLAVTDYDAGGAATADELSLRARRRSKEMHRRRSRSTKRDSYGFGGSGALSFADVWGLTGVPGARGSVMGMSTRTATTVEEDFYDVRDDPFRGF